MNGNRPSAPAARRVGIWFVSIIVLVVAGWLVYGFATAPNPPLSLSNDLNKTLPTDHVMGSGSTQLIEYSDFECPACKTYYTIVKQLNSDFAGKVTFIYRDFPLVSIHANAARAAEAAEAADLQGKFWEMHNKLFDGQDTWAAAKDPNPIFQQYAKDLGLNLDKFNSDINSSAMSDKIKAEENEGNSIPISGTPTFFLNGQQVSNPGDYENFKSILEKAVSAK